MSRTPTANESPGPRAALAEDWPARLVGIGVMVLLVLLAVGRQRALEPLSPPDLAFFHQSTWSAAHGLGFAQTALPFDGQTLTGCIHLSLVRAAWVPAYLLLPRVETLVALQAAAVGLGALLVAALARQAGLTGRLLPALLALAYAAHPMTLGLAVADVRPLIFAVPGVLLTVLGLRSGRAMLVLAGGVVVLSAREEALWLLAALLPAAGLLAWRSRRLAPLLSLGGLVAMGAALPLLAWGRLSNMAATTDHAATWAAIQAGERGLLRDPSEALFGLLSLLLCLPALRQPLLLLPGLAAWLYLATFSGLELAMAGEPGIHYLAVVQPYLWAAGAVGMWQISRPSRRWLPALSLVLLVISGALSLVRLPGLPAWGLASFVLPGEAAALHALAAPVAQDPGGLVAEPRLAPTLAGRAVLHVRGNLYADRTRLGELAPELDWALLDYDKPEARGTSAKDRGRPAEERRWWREALEGAGLEKELVRGSVERWGRPAPGAPPEP